MAITGYRRRKIILAAIVAGIILLGAAIYQWSRRAQTMTASASSSTFPVQRGDLVMSVTESGTIKARNAVEIKSRVEGEATIISVVPEGSYVTAEDVANKKVLVELDSSRLRDNMNQQLITYNSAEADYTDAKESLTIQMNQNDSDIQQGLMTVKFAKMDLQKYLGEMTANKLVQIYETDPNHRPEIGILLSDPNQLGGESLQRYRELSSNIDLAKEELQRAESDLVWTQKLYDKDYVPRSDLENDKLKAKRLSIQWQQARTSMDLFIRYEFAKEAERLFSDYLEAERQLERIYAQTRSRQAQAESRLNSSKAQYELNKEQLERIQRQIEACTMVATEPGLVIYASSDNRRRFGGSRTNIEVGENIREREPIMTITNEDAMDIDVKVHETNVDKVRVGQPVEIVIDAQPDKIFNGRVLKIAPLPDPQSFFGNPDLKVYTTDVSLEGVDKSIKPGMSARVEILIAQLEDVLSIPIQCVANRRGQKVCYLATNQGPKEQVIQTGVFNDRFVQVLDGLTAGQEVLLNPPRLLLTAERDSMDRTETAKRSAKPGTVVAESTEPQDSPKPEGAPDSVMNEASERIKQMDTDGDGRISLSQEAPAQARQFMEPLDTNKDGFIDEQERTAAAAMVREGRRERTPRPEGGRRPDR